MHISTESQISATEMKNHGATNKQFLETISEEMKREVLSKIAVHYGVSSEEIYNELIDADAQHLLDYMTESERSAVHLFMQKFNEKNAA